MNHGTIYSVPQDGPPPPWTVSPALSQAEIRSIAEEIVNALDDPNFYFSSHEVSIVTDLLTRRLIKR